MIDSSCISQPLLISEMRKVQFPADQVVLVRASVW